MPRLLRREWAPPRGPAQRRRPPRQAVSPVNAQSRAMPAVEAAARPSLDGGEPRRAHPLQGRGFGGSVETPRSARRLCFPAPCEERALVVQKKGLASRFAELRCCPRPRGRRGGRPGPPPLRSPRSPGGAARGCRGSPRPRTEGTGQAPWGPRVAASPGPAPSLPSPVTQCKTRRRAPATWAPDICRGPSWPPPSSRAPASPAVQGAIYSWRAVPVLTARCAVKNELF